MNREQVKTQINIKIVNDELSEAEMMEDIMQMVDAHVKEQSDIQRVSKQRELLIGYNEYLEGMYNAKCLEDDDVDLYLKTNL